MTTRRELQPTLLLPGFLDIDDQGRQIRKSHANDRTVPNRSADRKENFKNDPENPYHRDQARCSKNLRRFLIDRRSSTFDRNLSGLSEFGNRNFDGFSEFPRDVAQIQPLERQPRLSISNQGALTAFDASDRKSIVVLIPLNVMCNPIEAASPPVFW